MKIAVIGANGKAGSLIVNEAVERGHDVTAIVRSANKSEAQHELIKDLFDLTKEDLLEFDAVVSAFGAFARDNLPQHTSSLEHLAMLLADTKIRLLIVGGAGSLYMDPEMSIQLSDTPDFPADYKPLARAMAEGLAHLRQFDNVLWTYISPAADFDADGAKTGDYILAGEVFTVNEAGQSRISYADYAVAMLDEIEKGSHIKKRISVLGK